MKQFIIIAVIMGCFSNILAQSPRFLLINEIDLSLNNTYSNYYYNSGMYGFGIGIVHSETVNKTLDLTIGTEYNVLNLGVKIADGGMGGANYSYGIIKKMDCITFPISVRFKTGKTVKLINDYGVFGDIVLFSSAHGKAKGIYPDSNGNMVNFDDEFSINNISSGTIGFLTGVGISYSNKTSDLMLRFEGRIRLTTFDNFFNYFRLIFSIKFYESM